MTEIFLAECKGDAYLKYRGVTSAYPKLVIFLIKFYLGLVNGCQGIDKKICCNQTSNSKKGDLPAIVFFQYNGYSGRIIQIAFYPSWIPIIEVTAWWEDRAGKSITWSQLPLALAWAITIHKSQGLTLERATINFGNKNFAAGLSFVAISCHVTQKGDFP